MAVKERKKLTMNNKPIVFYWSRKPGKIVNKFTGKEAFIYTITGDGPQYNFTALEWYQTLLESIVDVANQFYKETFKNGTGKNVNKIVVSRDGYSFIEFLASYKPDLENNGITGTLQNRFTIYLDKDKDPLNVVDLYCDDQLAGQVVILDMNII